MENEPKPCPFCGSTNLRTPPEHRAGLNIQKWYWLSVRCKSCQGEGPNVSLRQYKADGELYAHGSRRPKGAEGQARWDETVDKAIEETIRLWNVRH